MNRPSTAASFAALACLGLAAAIPSPALAYVGPGAGLGAIASLLAVVAGVIIAVLGVIVFPLRLLMKRLKRKA